MKTHTVPVGRVARLSNAGLSRSNGLTLALKDEQIPPAQSRAAGRNVRPSVCVAYQSQLYLPVLHRPCIDFGRHHPRRQTDLMGLGAPASRQPRWQAPTWRSPRPRTGSGIRHSRPPCMRRSARLPGRCAPGRHPWPVSKPCPTSGLDSAPSAFREGRERQRCRKEGRAKLSGGKETLSD